MLFKSIENAIRLNFNFIRHNFIAQIHFNYNYVEFSCNRKETSDFLQNSLPVLDYFITIVIAMFDGC